MKRIDKIEVTLAAILTLVILWAAIAVADDTGLVNNSSVTIAGDAQLGYAYIIDITADDTQPAANTKSWANIMGNITTAPPSGIVTGTGRWLERPAQWSLIEVGIFAHAINEANDANAGAFDVNAHAARQNGGAKWVFSGPVGIGNAQLSNNPYTGGALRGTALSPLADPNYKWADEMTLADKWPLGVYKAGYSGADDILQIVFPAAGYKYIWIGVDNANWTVVDHVYVVVSGSSG